MEDDAHPPCDGDTCAHLRIDCLTCSSCSEANLSQDSWDFTVLFLTTMSAIRRNHPPNYAMFTHYYSAYEDAVKRALLTVLHQKNTVRA